MMRPVQQTNELVDGENQHAKRKWVENQRVEGSEGRRLAFLVNTKIGSSSIVMAATLAPLYLHSMPLVMQGARHEGKTALNPILKVVTMLQELQKRVTKCYCKTNGGALEASTAAVNTKIPTAGASIKASEERKTQLEEEVEKARTDCNDAKTAVSDATALREKEADAVAA